MTARKKDGLSLDAKGLNLGRYCPDRAKRLTDGTPLDVRNAMKELAFVLDPQMPTGMDWHIWLRDSDRRWLAEVLSRIGSGEDPKSVLRLKGRRTSYRTLDELGEIQYQVEDLRRQGASRAKALALVASYRLGFDSKGRKPVPPTPQECNAEVERLKKMLGKKTREIFS